MTISIDEFIAAKADLELQISQAVASLVEAFQDRTGLTPFSIDIPMIEVTTFASTRPKYEVGSASVKIRL